MYCCMWSIWGRFITGCHTTLCKQKRSVAPTSEREIKTPDTMHQTVKCIQVMQYVHWIEIFEN